MNRTDSNQKGTGITEICCLIALVGIAAVASLGYLGNAVEKKFTDQANLLDKPSGGIITSQDGDARNYTNGNTGVNTKGDNTGNTNGDASYSSN